MLLRRAPGFVAALILLPLAILAPAIPGYTAMVCRMTGTTVPADCLATAEAERSSAPAPLHDGWTTASCCDVLQVTFAHPPADAQFEAPTAPVAVVPAARFATVPIATAGAIETGPRAPCRLGPPIRFVTQTFLI